MLASFGRESAGCMGGERTARGGRKDWVHSRGCIGTGGGGGDATARSDFGKTVRLFRSMAYFAGLGLSCLNQVQTGVHSANVPGDRCWQKQTRRRRMNSCKIVTGIRRGSASGPTARSSPCSTSYLLDTVSSDQSLRKPMTTNQLSLLRTAIGSVTQFREHLTGRPARANVMPCAFASLRLCVLTASVPTQRRRGAKTQRGPGQEVVDWIGRPRAIAENRSARLLTDEQSTASRWRNGRGSLRPVSMETLAATHPGRSVVIRTTMRRNLSFPTRFSGEPRMEHGWNTDSQKRPFR